MIFWAPLFWFVGLARGAWTEYPFERWWGSQGFALLPSEVWVEETDSDLCDTLVRLLVKEDRTEGLSRVGSTPIGNLIQCLGPSRYRYVIPEISSEVLMSPNSKIWGLLGEHCRSLSGGSLWYDEDESEGDFGPGVTVSMEDIRRYLKWDSLEDINNSTRSEICRYIHHSHELSLEAAVTISGMPKVSSIPQYPGGYHTSFSIIRDLNMLYPIKSGIIDSLDAVEPSLRRKEDMKAKQHLLRALSNAELRYARGVELRRLCTDQLDQLYTTSLNNLINARDLNYVSGTEQKFNYYRTFFIEEFVNCLRERMIIQQCSSRTLECESLLEPIRKIDKEGSIFAIKYIEVPEWVISEESSDGIYREIWRVIQEAKIEQERWRKIYEAGVAEENEKWLSEKERNYVDGRGALDGYLGMEDISVDGDAPDSVRMQGGCLGWCEGILDDVEYLLLPKKASIGLVNVECVMNRVREVVNENVDKLEKLLPRQDLAKCQDEFKGLRALSNLAHTHPSSSCSGLLLGRETSSFIQYRGKKVEGIGKKVEGIEPGQVGKLRGIWESPKATNYQPDATPKNQPGRLSENRFGLHGSNDKLSIHDLAEGKVAFDSEKLTEQQKVALEDRRALVGSIDRLGSDIQTQINTVNLHKIDDATEPTKKGEMGKRDKTSRGMLAKQNLLGGILDFSKHPGQVKPNTAGQGPPNAGVHQPPNGVRPMPAGGPGSQAGQVPMRPGAGGQPAAVNAQGPAAPVNADHPAPVNQGAAPVAPVNAHHPAPVNQGAAPAAPVNAHHPAPVNTHQGAAPAAPVNAHHPAPVNTHQGAAPAAPVNAHHPAPVNTHQGPAVNPQAGNPPGQVTPVHTAPGGGQASSTDTQFVSPGTVVQSLKIHEETAIGGYASSVVQPHPTHDRDPQDTTLLSQVQNMFRNKMSSI